MITLDAHEPDAGYNTFAYSSHDKTSKQTHFTVRSRGRDDEIREPVGGENLLHLTEKSQIPQSLWKHSPFLESGVRRLYANASQIDFLTKSLGFGFVFESTYMPYSTVQLRQLVFLPNTNFVR